MALILSTNLGKAIEVLSKDNRPELIMKCVIIAAGQGARLKSLGDVKPLIPLGNTPLIEHVIRNASQVNIDEFIVITGYKSQKLTAFLERLAMQIKIPIKTIRNPTWHLDNGNSVLIAKEAIDSPFFLLMADHIIDPAILIALTHSNYENYQVTLAVDSRLSNPHVDLDDVTKVLSHKGQILDIGKQIKEFNHFDTGCFICAPEFFLTLESLKASRSNFSLSDGIKAAAQSKKAASIVTEHFWIDIDTEHNYQQATKLLSERKLVH